MSLENATGAVIPPNFKVFKIDGSFAYNGGQHRHSDGKRTFHVIQMVVFQRGGQRTDEVLHTVKLNPESTLKVPDVLNQLLLPKIPKVIGKHMTGNSLIEMRLESGLMAGGSISKVIDGKAYGKGMRAHKITLQAI
ncbi:unnamed protein product [Ceutorhynchus assimilis]|uniref:Uncharacterized protein n=1 Tax=Ceutorhynchus assimilis TaxID=467358 RepID=A0A9N9QQ04_9CUCU|nr:unnamed protein product [Ceutorhynchus assimilis]